MEWEARNEHSDAGGKMRKKMGKVFIADGEFVVFVNDRD